MCIRDSCEPLHYLYRVVDEDGKDLVCPQFKHLGKCRKLKPNTKVDFRDLTTKYWVLEHLDKCSEPARNNGKYDCRPFLSFTKSFEKAAAFMVAKQRYQEAEFCVARLDLIALLRDNKIDEHSIADISSPPNFNSFFAGLVKRHNKGGRSLVNYYSKRSASARLDEVVIGTRGNWWVDYAVLVDMGDTPLENQTGGYNNTIFGSRLRKIHKNDRKRGPPP